MSGWMKTLLVATMALHLMVMLLVPGGSTLSDAEIVSFSGGLSPLGELVPSLRMNSLTPHPLPFWLGAGLWARLTRNPWLLRLPSMLTSLALVALLARFGTRHFSPWVGLLASLAYAVSPMAGLVGRGFAPDVALMAASLLSVDSLLSGWRREGRYSWLVFLLSCTFMLYWHAYGLFVYALFCIILGSLVLWQAKLRRRETSPAPVGEALVCLGLVLLAYLPWLLFMGPRIRFPLLSNPLRPSAFYSGVLRAYGAGSVVGWGVLALCAGVGVLLGLRPEPVVSSRGKVVLRTKAILPTFVLAMSALYVPCLFMFHRATMTAFTLGGLMALLPWFLTLASLGVARLLSRAWVPTAQEFSLMLLALAPFTALGWRHQATAPHGQASVWKEVASFLRDKVRPGDVVLVSPEDAKVYLMWACVKFPWAGVIRGVSWLSRFDAGPHMERCSVVWFCESGGTPEAPQVQVSRLLKLGSLDVGTPEALPYYVSNVDTRLERWSASGQSFTFSWALGTQAKLNYPLESNRNASVFVVRAMPYTTPQKVTVFLNKQRRGEILMEPGWRHYLLDFEPPVFLPGSYARIDFHFSTHRPEVSPDGVPMRPKAVALDYVAVFHKQRLASFPPEAKPREVPAPEPRAIRRALRTSDR